MAYKIPKSKRKDRIAYQMDFRGHIIQGRTKEEVERKLDKEARENKILWDMRM